LYGAPATEQCVGKSTADASCTDDGHGRWRGRHDASMGA
jgi:hypothetical protein